MTPPWHTATTRLARVARRRCRRPSSPTRVREHLGVLAAERLPAAFDHREPAFVVRRAAAPPSGCSGRTATSYSTSPSTISTSRPSASRSAPPSRRARRCGLDTTASICSCASQAASRSRLLVAERGERRVGGHAGAGLDPFRFGVPHPQQLHGASFSVSAKPSTCSSSASASSGSVTLIVVMPSARAGLRLMPRSSRNTRLAARHAEPLEHELVDARIRLAQAFDRRLDDDVEREVVEAVRPRPAVGRRPVVRERGRAQAVGADPCDRVQHLRAARRSAADRSPSVASASSVKPARVRFGFERAANSSIVSSPRSSAAHAPVSLLVRMSARTVPVARPGARVVLVERLERRREHDAAEVEDHRLRSFSAMREPGVASVASSASRLSTNAWRSSSVSPQRLSSNVKPCSKR